MGELSNNTWTNFPDSHKHLEGLGTIESAVSCILPSIAINGSGLLRQEGYDGVYSYDTNANVSAVNHPLFVEGLTGFHAKGALDMEPDLKTIRNIHLLKLENL